MVAGIVGAAPVLSWGEGDSATPFAESPPVSEPSAAPVASESAGTVGESNYLLGPGDVLDISVWKDEALTRSCVVRPDGVFSFPLIGEVRAEGRTATQIKTEIEKKLDRYVPGATVSLEVKQVNSLIIYVIGKVNNPGRFVMNTNVNVLQALATAGGLNVFAKRNRIKVFRQADNETVIFPFEYDDVVDGTHLDRNIMLKRGDVVVIP